MPEYIFHLGSFPDLAFAELKVLFGAAAEFMVINDSLVVLDLESDEKAQAALKKTGGTVKISRVIRPISDDSPENIATIIHEQHSDLNKIHFGFAEINRDHLPVIEPMQIKQALADLGMSSRYVKSSRSGLSAAVLLHQKKVKEFNVVTTPETVLLSQTVAIQDIDLWTTKDRGKPYFDRKKGMLPPKTALMMLNLAVKDADPTQVALLDPFCGTGTVLLEAVENQIAQVYGTDSDQEAISGARVNLDWFTQTIPNADSSEWNVLVSDVSHLRPEMFSTPITHIVTEPFLGKPTPQPQQMPGIFKGLQKLYLGAFKTWTKILADEATIVMVLPQVNSNHPSHFSYDWSPFIDKIEKLGYTTVSKPLVYARPNAVIERQITEFRFTRKK